MRLRAGRLRHRVVLQYPVDTRSATGGVTTTYTADSTVWAAIEPISGKEYLASQQAQNEVSVSILIRYHPTIDESWRVTHGGKTYAIETIINHDMRNHLLTLMCSEGTKVK